MSDSVCLSSTVKQAGKDFTYLIVVLIGLGVTGDVFDLAQTKAWLDHHATGPRIARGLWGLWGPGLIVCRKTTRAFRHQHALPNNDDWVYLALFICFLYMLFLLELDFFPPVILILVQVMLLCFCHFFISALFELPKQILIVLVNSNNTVPKCVPKI